MTSSFTQPGGNTFTQIFQARQVMISSNQRTQFLTATPHDRKQLHWVEMQGKVDDGGVVVRPPSRAPSYAGQIIAVTAPVITTRS